MTTLESLPTSLLNHYRRLDPIVLFLHHITIDWLSPIFQPTGALEFQLHLLLVVSLKSFYIVDE